MQDNARILEDLDYFTGMRKIKWKDMEGTTKGDGMQDNIRILQDLAYFTRMRKVKWKDVDGTLISTLGSTFLELFADLNDDCSDLIWCLKVSSPGAQSEVIFEQEGMAALVDAAEDSLHASSISDLLWELHSLFLNMKRKKVQR